MSGPPPKATAKKPKKPTVPLTYTMEIDESGTMRRAAITTPVIQSSAKPPVTQKPTPAPAPVPVPVVEEEEELVFNAPKPVPTPTVEEEEEELIFNAPKPAPANDEEEELIFNAPKPAPKPVPTPTVEEEEELIFNAPKPRKETKAEKNMNTAVDDVERMKLFYRYRSKNPLYFQYTAEGNLEIKANNPLKVPSMVVPMRAFNALRPEELEEIEIQQKEQLLETEGLYVNKLRELREAHDAYNPEDPTSTAKVVRLNMELEAISKLRSNIQYPEKWTNVEQSVDIRHILLSQPHEERKFPYPIYIFKRYPFSRNDVEGHYREHGEASEDIMEGGGTVVLFITNPDDQKTGMFHPAAEREFVYNETKYASPYQAFETERFKALEDDEMVKKLLGTRSALTIKNLVKQESKQPQFPVKLWEEILETMYSQFKDAADKLKSTGSARFHMMDKQIGTPEYAMALANVRTKLKETENDAPANVGPINQSVITKEQQQKDKVGAIINNRRFG